jgi:inosine-uridine nucleoside N-ribohydrolase
MRTLRLVGCLLAATCFVAALGAEQTPRIGASARNLLVGAKVTSNLASYELGLRGQPDHLIYDLQKRRFVKRSQWHEYGVGFGKDMGVVPEGKPAFWMAEWARPVRANLIVLSGAYPNQPQPQTCWKIEVRRGGKWTTHARGKGGWYSAGRYVWGGAGTEPIALDGFRVSVFSKDDKTPVKSIHFRGEEGVSWVVASVPPIDARIVLPRRPVRAGEPALLKAEAVAGKITSWRWELGGKTLAGPKAEHTFAEPGEREVRLVFSDGKHTAAVRATVHVAKPVAARIAPLGAPVMAGKAVAFADGGSVGRIKSYAWDFGGREAASGPKVTHTFAKAGIYRVKLTVSDGKYSDEGFAIVRVHTPETLHVPQVVLDTDQKNEQDDQHYFGYGLFSELDVLGVNSVHHGGGQEPVNYRELVHVLGLAKASGLPAHREPFIFRGANQRLAVPPSGKWADTQPIVTDASRAILAAARGASPTSPVWVVPVGPGTNAACAILQARAEGLKLAGRIRIMWLGGSNTAIRGEFNGNNDPWSMYVVAQSGIETWIMPAPVGARVRIDKRTEADMYADNSLGRYLLKIVPARNKPLFDPSCLSAIISMRLGLGWVKEAEPVTVGGPREGYRWRKTDRPTSVRVIRQIDQQAMKMDIFQTMKGKARCLIGVKRKG